MDALVMTAYSLVATYLGFVIGVLVRGSYLEGRPPGGGEPPADPPDDPSPEDWALWEEELAPVPAGAS
jgi:hypothetical protein